MDITALHPDGSARGTPRNLAGGAAEDPLRAAADRLEAGFLSEMLKAAKVGEPRESFGGGIGEAQFASFLRERIADGMVAEGGIGLGERLFEALKAHDDGGA